MSPHEAFTVFLSKERFLLLIHCEPDGDAVASSLALGLSLRSLSKAVDIVCADPIPYQFQFLPGANTIKSDFLVGDYDVIVTLDCGDSKRTGFSSRLKTLVQQKKVILINIDHHPKNDLHGLATYNYVDYEAPSTSFLVYQIIRGLGVAMNHKLATCLLTGLYTDTGGFKHPNTTADSLKFASLMLSYGARLKDITHHITQAASVSRLKLWGVALSRIQQHNSYDLVSTVITHKDIEAAGASDSDIAGIAALLSTVTAEVAIMVVQLADGSTQVRMRTKNKNINLARLANYLGGGGRRQSAGFMCVNQS